MTRRRCVGFGLLAGLLALGAGVWLIWPRAGITRENAARIRPGMTLAEVEAILGGPARDEAATPMIVDEFSLPATPGTKFPRTWRTWRSDEGWLLVGFDAAERADMIHNRFRPGWLDKLRHSIGY